MAISPRRVVCLTRRRQTQANPQTNPKANPEGKPRHTDERQTQTHRQTRKRQTQTHRLFPLKQTQKQTQKHRSKPRHTDFFPEANPESTESKPRHTDFQTSSDCHSAGTRATVQSVATPARGIPLRPAAASRTPRRLRPAAIGPVKLPPRPVGILNAKMEYCCRNTFCASFCLQTFGDSELVGNGPPGP